MDEIKIGDDILKWELEKSIVAIDLIPAPCIILLINASCFSEGSKERGGSH